MKYHINSRLIYKIFFLITYQGVHVYLIILINLFFYQFINRDRLLLH